MLIPWLRRIIIISEVDIADWDRVENIIDNLKIESGDAFSNDSLTWENYNFIMKTIMIAKQGQKKPKLPAILSWWRAA